jgi:hypothetical protein
MPNNVNEVMTIEDVVAREILDARRKEVLLLCLKPTDPHMLHIPGTTIAAR